MDEIIYEYNGKQYTRTQLEEKYGDKVDKAISSLGFKEISQATEPEQEEQPAQEEYEYNGKTYTRQQLEERYGDKVEKALSSGMFKPVGGAQEVEKKSSDQAGDSTGEAQPLASGTGQPSETTISASSSDRAPKGINRTTEVLLEGEKDPSTVLMSSHGDYSPPDADGKYVAFPTLFPKDPNNQTSDPKDWIRAKNEDEAYEIAKERGEVLYFDTPEEASTVAKGSWKEEKPVKPLNAPDPAEDEGWWSNLYRQIRTGSADVGAMIASVPETLYNLAAIPQNAIADATGIDSLRADADKFKKNMGVENSILDFYSAEVKKLEGETENFNRNRYGTDEDGNLNTSITEQFSNGNYQAGFELLGSGIGRSAPVSVAMMAGGAMVGSAGKLAAVTTPMFVEGERQQLKTNNPEMGELELTIKSLGLAGAETVFASIGTGTIGAAYKDIIMKEGQEQGTKIFRDGLITAYKEAIKKYGAVSSSMGEGIEEVATAITQNMISGRDPMQGVGDAFLQGLGGGAVHGAPINAIKAKRHVEEGMQRRNIKKTVEGAGYGDLTEVFKQNDEINDTQLTIAGKKYSRNILEKDLRAQVQKGDITAEEAQANLNAFDETAVLLQATEGANLTETQKVKAVNLLRERERLDAKVKGKNKGLFKKENERIKEIDEQLSVLSSEPAKPTGYNEVLQDEGLSNTVVDDTGVTVGNVIGWFGEVMSRDIQYEQDSDFKEGEEYDHLGGSILRGLDNFMRKMHGDKNPKTLEEERKELEEDPAGYIRDYAKQREIDFKEREKEGGEVYDYEKEHVKMFKAAADKIEKHEGKQKPEGTAVSEDSAKGTSGAEQTRPDQSNSGDVRQPAAEETGTQDQEITVSETLNRPVTINTFGGSKLDTPVTGDMYVDGQTVVVEDANGKIYEIGNVDEIQDKDLSELGLQYDNGITISPEGNITYNDTEWRLQEELPSAGIEYNEDGSVKAVSLKETGSDKTTMLTGPEATEVVYQKLLRDAQTPEQIERVNQALEQDEEFQNELREAEVSTEEETDTDTEESTKQPVSEAKSKVAERREDKKVVSALSKFVPKTRGNATTEANPKTDPNYKKWIGFRLYPFSKKSDSSHILDFIEQVIPSKYSAKYKALYEMAARNGIKVRVASLPVNYRGAYQNGVITFDPKGPEHNMDNWEQFVETLNHEIIHGLMFHGNNHFEELHTELKGIYDRVQAHKDKANAEVRGILDYIESSSEEFKDEDGIRDFEELITHAFTNKAFAEFLDSIPATTQPVEKGGKSIFTQLKELLRDAIGKVVGGRTALDEISESVEKYFNIDWHEEYVAEKGESRTQMGPSRFKEATNTNTPEVAWDTALNAAADTIDEGKSVDKAIIEGLKAFQATEFYSNIQGPKKEVNDLIRKELEATFGPLKNAQRNPKKTNPKTEIRKNTGQTDTSKKVTTTERKLLKDQLKAESKAARLAYYHAKKQQLDVKAFKEAVKAMVGSGRLTPKRSAALINRALSLDPTSAKQVDSFFDYVGRSFAAADLKVKLNQIEKDKKRVLRNVVTKFGKYGTAPRILANLDTELVPMDQLQEYAQVIRELAKADNFDPKKAQALVDSGLGDTYKEQLQEAYAEKLLEEKKEEDKTREIEILEEVFDELEVEWANFDQHEVSLIRKFQNIPKDWMYENLNKKTLSALAKSLRALGNGAMLNKTMEVVVMKYEAVELARDIRSKIGNTFIKPVRNLFQVAGNKIKEAFKGQTKANKSYKTDDYRKAINSVMVQHINTVITQVKGMDLYKSVLHPVTSQLNKAHEEVAIVEKNLMKKFKDAQKSRKRSNDYQFETQVLLQHYFRQKEFENEGNLEMKVKGKERLFSAREHMEATRANLGQTDYSEESMDKIEEMFNKFTNADGEFDTQKAWNYFNAAERELITYIQENLKQTKGRSEEVNNHLRGETLNYPEDYFPRRASGKSEEFVDGVDMNQRMAALLGSQSTKATASNSRSATKAMPLSYDTLSTFMSHFKENAIEYNVSYDLKKAGIVITELKKEDKSNESVAMLAKALESGLKITIQAEMGHSTFTPKSRVEQLYRYTVRRTFNRMLIDPIRLGVDIASQYSFFYAGHVDKLGAMTKAHKKLNEKFDTGRKDKNGKPIEESFKNILFKDFGSTHMSRLGGNRTVDLQESEMSSLSKASFKQANPSLADNFVDFMKKNKVTDVSDTFGALYYEIADAPAKQKWSLTFEESFKKATGESFSTKKYVNDPTYKMTHEKGIKAAIQEADKLTSNMFNTATKTEQKLENQANRGDTWTSINSFMRSFTYNENRVFWDSLQSLFASETLGIKGTMGRGEALRTQLLVNGRGIMYTFLMQTAVQAILSAFVPDMDDDEELMEKAGIRALAQHGMLLFAGNRGLLFNIGASMAIERAREIEHNNNPHKETTFDSFEDGILYGPPERGNVGAFAGQLGAEGYALRTIYDFGDLTAKIGEKAIFGEDPITEEDWVEWKAAQIGVGTVSQIFGLPINRLGILTQKYLQETLDN